jgi:hypothetical protein
VPQAAWGSAVPIDPSTSRIEVRAPGKITWSTTATVDADHPHVVVTVPALDDAPAPAAASGAPQARPSLVGPLVLGGVGVAAAAVGTYFGLRTIDASHDRDAACPGGKCNALAPQYYSDAQTYGAVSTVSFVTAGASIAAGALWWWIGARRANARAGAGPALVPVAGAMNGVMLRGEL